MAFQNRIRLPFKITRPQFPEERNVFTKADGTRETLSVVVSKTYEGETDWIPERWHERLVIALAHDNVSIEGEKYFGQVSKEGDYTIAWPQAPMDYPTAKAKFIVAVTPFDGTNSNCMSCEQAAQLELNDDTFENPLSENTTYEIQVEENDKICCYPAVFSITSFDTEFFDTCTIDQTGKVTLHTKSGLPDTNSVIACTYRVTCPNGSFDEADVICDIDGTLAAVCLAPKALSLFSKSTTVINVRFTQPNPLPDHFHFRVVKSSAPGVEVDSGDVATVLPAGGFNVFSGNPLEPGTEYILCVRSQCDATNDDATASAYVCITISTNPQTQLCGQYSLSYDNPSDVGPGMGGHLNVSYVDCNGNNQVKYVPNHVTVPICAMQTGPNAPTYISAFGNPSFHYTYDGILSCGS